MIKQLSKLITIAVLLIGLMAPAAIYAAERNVVSAPTDGGRPRDQRPANGQDRCTIITNNTTRLVNHYNEVHQKQLKTYTTIKENIQKAMARLKELGYDTSAIDQKLQQLATMLSDFQQTRVDFQTKMAEIKTAVCDQQDTSAYKTKVQEAQNILKKMRDQAKSIVTFYRTDVKNAIKDIRNQKPVSGPKAI